VTKTVEALEERKSEASL